MKKLPILAAIAGLLWPCVLLAHGGGLDSNDCHRETATGGYHCHPQDDDEKDWETAGYVVVGLLLVWAIYEWAKDDDMGMASRLQIAPYFTENDHAGLVAEYALGDGHRLGFQTEHRMGGPQDETRLRLHWTVGF